MVTRRIVPPKPPKPEGPVKLEYRGPDTTVKYSNPRYRNWLAEETDRGCFFIMTACVGSAAGCLVLGWLFAFIDWIGENYYK